MIPMCKVLIRTQVVCARAPGYNCRFIITAKNEVTTSRTCNAKIA